MEADLEKKIIKICFGISFLIHIILYTVNFEKFNDKPTPNVDEWVIETDISDFAVPFANVKNKMETASTKQKLLPQLPKKFQINQNDGNQELFTEKGEVLNKNKNDAKASKLEQKNLAIKQKKDATKIYKRDLIHRLRREQQRLQKKSKKENLAELKLKKKVDTLLEKRKQELEKIKSNSHELKATQTHPYLALLKDQVSKSYTLPDLYKNSTTDYPIILISITPEGKILNLEIFKTSKNNALDQLALKALQNAAPYPKPPKEFWGQSFKFVFNFKST